MNNRFTAGNKGEGFSGFDVTAQNGSQKTARFPGFAGEQIGQKNRLIAESAGGIRRCGAELPNRTVNMGFHVVQGFRRFLPKKRCGFRRKGQPVFLHYSQSLLTGAAVGICGAAGDAVERVSKNVAEDNAEDLCRPAGLSETAALDGGKTFADAVHFHDVGAAGQKLTGDILQLCAGNEGSFKQGAAAA